MHYAILHNKTLKEVLNTIKKYFPNLQPSSDKTSTEFDAKLPEDFHSTNFESKFNYILFELYDTQVSEKGIESFILSILNEDARSSYSNYFNIYFCSAHNQNPDILPEEINLKDINDNVLKQSNLVKLLTDLESFALFAENTNLKGKLPKYKRAFIMDYVSQSQQEKKK